MAIKPMLPLKTVRKAVIFLSSSTTRSGSTVFWAVFSARGSMRTSVWLTNGLSKTIMTAMKSSFSGSAGAHLRPEAWLD
jgi:hypothetical protein